MPEERPPNSDDLPRQGWLRKLLGYRGVQSTNDTITALVGEHGKNIAVGKNIIQIIGNTLNLPTYLVVTIMVGMAALVVTAGVSAYWDNRATQISETAVGILSSTATPTATPSITPTPLPTATRIPMNGSFNIVIAQFGRQSADGAIQDSRDGQIVSEWLAEELDSQLNADAVGNVLIWHDQRNAPAANRPIGLIGSDAEAAALAGELIADMVIYGYFTDSTTTPKLNLQFYYLSSPLREEPDASVGRHQLGQPILIEYANEQEFTGLRANLKTNSPLAIRTKALVWLTQGIAKGLFGQREDGVSIFQQAIGELGQVQPGPGTNYNDVISVLYFFYGRAALTLKRFSVAEAAYNEALALNDQYVNAYIGRGNVYLDQGQFFLQRQQPPSPVSAVASCMVAAGIDPTGSSEQLPQTPAAARSYLARAGADYQKAMELAQLGIAANSATVWPSSLPIAQFMLGNSYRLTADTYIFEQDYAEAEPILDNAAQTIAATLPTLAGGALYEFSALAYSGLGQVKRAQGYIKSVQAEQAQSMALFNAGLADFRACSAQGSLLPPAKADKFFQAGGCFCRAYEQEILDTLQQQGEGVG